VQDEDDERRDLERALFARPSGDAEGESRRIDAERRLRLEQEAARIEAARIEAAQDPRSVPASATAATPGTATRAGAAPAPTAPAPAGTAPRRAGRAALPLIGALAVGLVLGAVAVELLPGGAGAATPTPTPTPPLEDRYSALIEGWVVAPDLPVGMELIARGTDVYTPQFETVQDDRLLVTSPGGVSLCIALQRGDGSLSAACTGLEAFFTAGSLDVVGTDPADGTPVYTRVSLRSDGSVEGGFQLVQDGAPEA